METGRRRLGRVHLRLALLGLTTSVWIVALCCRLAYLQVWSRDDLRERAELQQQHTLTLEATRGAIYDRNGRELAVSVEQESIYAVPQAVADGAWTARLLGRCLGEDPAGIARRLSTDRRFIWVERKVPPAEVDCVRRLQLAGVGFLPENRRFYPKREVAAHVLGYVGMDNEGMSGIEYALNRDIQGRPGKQIIWTDARRRRAASRVEKKALPGRSVQLTLDETLQHMTERELLEAVRESGAQSGTAILMHAETGEILALAGVPAFNPNRYGAYPPSSWRNRAVTDAYEPGSTFKIVTAAAALEEGLVTEEERIDCGRGSIEVAGRVIRDHKVFDVLSFREVVANSSNVGMIRIGQRLGNERFASYVRAFGFGEASGLRLPAESRGLLRPGSRWSLSTLASISFGQEIGVTPVQMVSAANAIAASGRLMRPRLVARIESPEGETLARFGPEVVRRVVSPETAARMTEILVGVVENGTGRRAAIPGYRVAGKTGTAQKALPGGGYSKVHFVSSFVGFAPAERPELTALVILDSPRGDYSGGRAAAVFSRIVGRALHSRGVSPRLDEARITVAARWPAQPPLEGPREPERGEAGGPAVARVAFGGRSPAGAIRVPRLEGLSARDAVARILAARCAPAIVGSGWVVEQDPPAGSLVAPGTRCSVVLGPPGGAAPLSIPTAPSGAPRTVAEAASPARGALDP